MADKIQTIAESDLKRIARAVRLVEAQGPKLGAKPDTAPMTLESIAVYNATGAEIPLGGIVRLSTLQSDGILHTVIQPTYPGRSDVAIAVTAIPAAEAGRVWLRGTHPILASAYADLVAGERLDATANSFYAQSFELGPFRVTGGALPAGLQPSGLPSGVGLVMVEITGQRGNAIVMTNDDDTVLGAALTLILGPGLTGTMERPGVMRLDKG